jgi:poly(beta-D-mannuronate) lyase
MPFIRRFASLCALAVALVAAAPGPASALSYEERQRLDLSAYTVTRPDASFMDVADRMALLRQTGNPMLRDAVQRLVMTTGCRSATNIPVIDFFLRVPGFYPEPLAWRTIAHSLFAFEDAVSGLAGAYIASSDRYYADCLVDLLDKWASRNALIAFHHDNQDAQAWYSIESMIFAAALAYSTVRATIEVSGAKAAQIERWLVELAQTHTAIPGSSISDCCNNHFYRRALYAVMVGVLAGDDALFRFGVSAIYSALHEMDEGGAFPREMVRGGRAMHYQNYALLYLVPIMHIVSRQGYPIFELTINGRTMDDAVAFALDIIKDPAALEDRAPATQYKGFLKDDQYFAWMEIWLQHRADPRVAAFIRPYRPIYNRGVMGHVTLLFMDPAEQRQSGRRVRQRATQVEAADLMGE